MVILLLARVSYILDNVNEYTDVEPPGFSPIEALKTAEIQPETRLKDAHARPRLPLPCLPHPLRDARLPSFHELFELVQRQRSEDGVGVGVGVSRGVMAWVWASRRGVGLASRGVLRVGRGVSGSEASAGQRRAGHGRIRRRAWLSMGEGGVAGTKRKGWALWASARAKMQGVVVVVNGKESDESTAAFAAARDSAVLPKGCVFGHSLFHFHIGNQ
ncbi:hypothetical protein FB45DRAFT_877646 [Roridomyces roridus]|uniref:Uncharacterized protein n=1 Tax=Roridomyces roridus TaxID=1738132 RepID=A0AAD7FAT8_9AGAR|nr:hypothetical protein FB45DRAFT_877646 [Roridomyces roridus]